MALKHKIDWDPEEVAAGYDFSSIYEGMDENTTVPVISSVVNTTDLAGPAANITVGFNKLLNEVVEKVVTATLNTTNNTISTVPPSSSTPSTVSSLADNLVAILS